LKKKRGQLCTLLGSKEKRRGWGWGGGRYNHQQQFDYHTPSPAIPSGIEHGGASK